MKALIVDDDPRVSNFIGELFQEKGVVIDIANTYDSAIKLFNNSYNILFVDYFLDNNKTGKDIIEKYSELKCGFESIIFTGKAEKIDPVYRMLDKMVGYDKVKEAIFDIIEKAKNKIKEPVIMQHRVEESDISSFCPAHSGIIVKTERNTQDIADCNKEIKGMKNWVIVAMATFALECLTWVANNFLHMWK
jgi:DNA-binding NtrC family response regulator